MKLKSLFEEKLKAERGKSTKMTAFSAAVFVPF
jgi:hypothetical protein